MSEPIRLLLSDVDGTIVRNDKNLAAPVVAAVKRVLDAGIAVSLISARPPSGVVWIAKELGLTGPLGAFNGGTIVSPDGTIVAADRLDPADVARTLDLLDRPGVTPWLFADGRWYARTSENRFVPREKRSAGIGPTIMTDFSGLTERVDKIVGVSEDHDALAALDDEIARVLGDKATVGRSQPYYLDITAPAANKGDGITALAGRFGVPLAQVAVIGDQRNDLAMFARAGISFAMGQGPAEVRAAATHAVASNEEDGVADAIARFILPAAQA